MDEKEQNEKKTEELKTSTQDPETHRNRPEGNVALPLLRNASVESSDTGGTGDSPKTDVSGSNQKSTESPVQNQTIASGSSLETEENVSGEKGTGLPSKKKEDSGLETTTVQTSDLSTESNPGGKKAGSSSGVVSLPTSGSLNDKTPSGGSSKDSPAAGKSDKTASPEQHDPEVLSAVKHLQSGNVPARNPPQEGIEMQEIQNIEPPAGNPAAGEGGVCDHPAHIDDPVEDAFGSGEGWDCGCMSIVCLLLLAFIFAALSPVIGMLVSQLNNNSTVAEDPIATNGTNATYSNETFDNASYVDAASQFFTTVLYDVLSSNRT